MKALQEAPQLRAVTARPSSDVAESWNITLRSHLKSPCVVSACAPSLAGPFVDQLGCSWQHKAQPQDYHGPNALKPSRVLDMTDRDLREWC